MRRRRRCHIDMPGDGQMHALQPQRVSGNDDHGAGMSSVQTLGQGLGPAREIVEYLGGELAQRQVHVRGLGQARVEELFARPRGLAEVVQPHHAGAALQGMEGPPDRGHVGGAVGVVGQTRQAGAGVADHLGGLVDEDAAHLGVVPEPCAVRRHGGQHRRGGGGRGPPCKRVGRRRGRRCRHLIEGSERRHTFALRHHSAQRAGGRVVPEQ